MRAFGVSLCTLACCYTPATLSSPTDDASADGSVFDTGLVGWWRFDEGTGSSTVDQTGNAGTTTVPASVTFGAGPPGLGTALLFNGSNGLDVGHNSHIDNLTTMTISAWIASDGTGFRRIVSKEASSAAGRWLFGLDEPDGDLSFVKSFAVDLHCDTALGSLGSTGAWQHVAVTTDGTTDAVGVVLYIGGTPVTQTVASTSGQGGRASDDTISLVIGNNTTGGRGFFGGIDDVRIYNRVLSPTEIMALAHP